MKTPGDKTSYKEVVSYIGKWVGTASRNNSSS